MARFKFVYGSREAFCAKLEEATAGLNSYEYTVHYFEPCTDSLNNFQWYSAIIEFYEDRILEFLESDRADEPAAGTTPHPVTPPDNYYWDHVVD